uniref:Uncharacterized protein n=1 Tax=Arundo donax TaxID=35708 RepID=A0A0A9BV92_ARUDO
MHQPWEICLISVQFYLGCVFIQTTPWLQTQQPLTFFACSMDRKMLLTKQLPH